MTARVVFKDATQNFDLSLNFLLFSISNLKSLTLSLFSFSLNYIICCRTAISYFQILLFISFVFLFSINSPTVFLKKIFSLLNWYFPLFGNAGAITVVDTDRRGEFEYKEHPYQHKEVGLDIRRIIRRERRRNSIASEEMGESEMPRLIC